MADHSSSFLIVTILVLIVVLLVFGMKYFAAARTERLNTTGETAYRDLSARAVKAQEESAAALSGLAANVSDIRDRLSRVEKVLKEVE